MKLHEIKRLRPRSTHETIEVEPAGGIYGTFDVDVQYTYAPSDDSFKERHSEINIESVSTTEKVFEFDDNNEKTGKSWPIGTDATKIPGWDDSDDKYILEKLWDIVE
jgi:hypothetical protein